MKPVATGFPDDEDPSKNSFRILSTDAKLELQQLLQHISSQRSVVGVLVIGHDGLLIAGTLSPEFDAEKIGKCALGIYMDSSVTASKIGHQHIHQIVCRVTRGYVVIADFGGGLLVIISDD